MILNWPKGFGTFQALMVGSMEKGQPDLIMSRGHLLAWLDEAGDNFSSEVKANPLIGVAYGEILLDKMFSDAEEGVETGATGGEENLRDSLLDLREKTDTLGAYVFYVELRELWPLLIIGKSWAVVLESGVASFDGDGTNFFVETAVESLQPTKLTEIIMEAVKKSREPDE